AEVGSVYLKARGLSQRLGETANVSEALWGLWAFYIVRAEFVAAREIGEELLRMGERLPYAGLRMRGHLAMQVTYMHLGEFGRSIEHYEKALLLHDPERHRDDALLYFQDPGVAIRSHAAWTLWFLGQPDQALWQMQEALSLARELGEPHGLAHAFYFAAILHELRREARLAQEWAEATFSVSSEHGLVLYQAFAT